MAKKEPNGEDIIKYLGYNVHPGKIGEFWQSEEEKKRYVQEVRERGGVQSVMERESALLNVRLMTPVDRIIGFIGSAFLILSFFLPVYSFDAGGQHVSGSAISYFINIGNVIGGASEGGFILLLAMLLFTLVLLANPVLGVLNILGLVNKQQGDAYLEAVKKNTRLTFILLILYGVLFLALLIGASQPAGLSSYGDTFGLASIFKLTGVGFWLGIAGLAIVFAERRGI